MTRRAFAGLARCPFRWVEMSEHVMQKHCSVQNATKEGVGLRDVSFLACRGCSRCAMVFLENALMEPIGAFWENRGTRK